MQEKLIQINQNNRFYTKEINLYKYLNNVLCKFFHQIIKVALLKTLFKNRCI